MIQTYTVPVSGRQINAAGTFFRYESSGIEGSDQSLKVRIDGNDAGTFLPGDSIEIPGQASTWELVPLSCSAIVKVGFGRITSVRTAVVGSMSVSSMPALTIASLPQVRPLANGSSSAKTVTSGGGQLLPANPLRGSLEIQNNDSAGVIVVHVYGGTAILNPPNGIRIAPGGSWYWPPENCPQGVINAIGSIASNPNVTVVEG